MSAPSLNGELGGILRVVRVNVCLAQPALGRRAPIDPLNCPWHLLPWRRVAACTPIHAFFKRRGQGEQGELEDND